MILIILYFLNKMCIKKNIARIQSCKTSFNKSLVKGVSQHVLSVYDSITALDLFYQMTQFTKKYKISIQNIKTVYILRMIIFT